MAAVHAGWRGLVGGVLQAAVKELGAPLAAAAIGPCLSLARFEVGPEVADAFRRADLEDTVHEGEGPRPHVDLRAGVARVLERAGAVRIDVSRTCTWEDERLFSYRRDITHGAAQSTGRQGAWIEACSRATHAP